MAEPQRPPPHRPPPPRPRSDGELGFTRKKPVRWFSPSVLLGHWQRQLLSAALGAFLDKRELQATVAPVVLDHGDPAGEAWVDFLADTGDGFDATYSIAWLTAQKELTVEGLPGDPLPRAGLLVLGGDEAYPAGAPDEYANRFQGPYQASFPFTRDGSPMILAIPGNHDWYDGLTSFLRLFCRKDGNWIGARRTVQRHSYFAVRLPQDWWLWGIDIQFDNFIDDPQLEFFGAVAETLTDDARIILCTAKPSWTHVRDDPAAFRNLGYFQSRIIHPSKGKLVVSLSGDSHHYARYAGADRSQRITAGGGGAFLRGTHHLDDWLDVPTAHGDATRRYDMRCRYPSRAWSRLSSAGALRLPLRNPTFLFLPAVVYLVLGWATQFAARVLDSRLAGPLDAAAPKFGWHDIAAGLIRNPVSVLVLVVVLGGLMGFAKPPDTWSHGWRKVTAKILMGAAHFALQLAVGIFVVAPSAIWIASVADGFWFGVALLGALLVVGGLAAALVIGAYLAVCCAWLRAHGNHAFSAMRSTSYKNFLRLHIDGDGRLTVYPIGLDRATTSWTYDPENGDEEAPWLAPAAGRAPRARLIEEPFVIDPRR